MAFCGGKSARDKLCQAGMTKPPENCKGAVCTPPTDSDKSKDGSCSMVLIRLKDGTQVLVPLALDSNGQLTNAKFGDSKVSFDVELADTVEKIEFQILDNQGKVLYSQFYNAGEMIQAGEHTWEWDGFDQNGVFDTEQLKNGISVQVNVTQGENIYHTTETINISSERADWVDVRVDRNQHTIDIKFYVDFKNPHDLSPSTFSRLQQLSLNGISHYWSRNVTIDGSTYVVKSTATLSVDHSESFPIHVETGGKYSRSFNSGLFIIGEVLIYNQGHFLGSPSYADQDFQAVSAHEFGHSVLETFGGKGLSWGHEGTTGSSLFDFSTFQKPLPSAPSYPPPGNIDLMKYYQGQRPGPYYWANAIATEENIKQAIWIAQVNFEEE